MNGALVLINYKKNIEYQEACYECEQMRLQQVSVLFWLLFTCVTCPKEP